VERDERERDAGFYRDVELGEKRPAEAHEKDQAKKGHTKGYY